MATSESSSDGVSRSSTCRVACSALAQMNSALVMPLRAALAAASATACALLSMPITRLTERAIASPMVPVPQQTSSSTESGPRLHCARSSVSRLSAPSVLTWKNASGEMRKERPSSVSSMYSRPSTVSTPSASADSPACLYSPGGAPRRTASERRTGGSSGATNASRSRASSEATCSSGKPAACTATQSSSSGGPSACAKDWRASIARQKPSCETLSYGGSGDSARTACALRAAASISAETVGTPSARPTTCLRSRTVPRVKPTATLPSSSRPIVNSHLFR
mmetsp:Transcript_33797/g.111803  ORF Transcript_33797/g.111803 Transcript_33797/m.111803 type:complete len:281 (+) Transcript_33797:693-1535(+)